MKKLHTIDRIYIICNKEKEIERYNKWTSWIADRNDVEFFSYNWSDTIDKNDSEYWYVRNPEIEKLESQYRTFPLNNAEISCSLNWIKLLEKIYYDGYDRVLIFESDAYFDEYFEDDFNRAIKLIQGRNQDLIDIVSIGTGSDTHVSLNEKVFIPGIYKVDAVRALEAVIMSRKGVEKTLDYVHKNKLTMVFDIELAYAIKKGLVSMWWLEPPIVRQTSVDGLSQSFLNQGQFHLLNNKKYGQR